MVLVELDSVTMRGIRQETVIGATLRIKNIGCISFVPTVVILQRALKKLCVRGWTAFSWLKTWSNGGFM
jgi:hypothetical protein